MVQKSSAISLKRVYFETDVKGMVSNFQIDFLKNCFKIRTCRNGQTEKVHGCSEFVFEINKEKSFDETETISENETNEQKDANVQVLENFLYALPSC